MARKRNLKQRPWKLTEKQKLLASDPLMCGHAKAMARKFVGRRGLFGQLDHYESAALLGLCVAAKRYRESFGVPFHRYATMTIGNQLLDVFRSNQIGGRHWPADKPRPVVCSYHQFDHSFQSECEVFASRDLPVGWEIESEDTVRYYASQLPASGSYRRVLIALYLRAAHHRATFAREMGMCESNLSHADRKSREFLRGEVRYLSRAGKARRTKYNLTLAATGKRAEIAEAKRNRMVAAQLKAEIAVMQAKIRGSRDRIRQMKGKGAK